MSVGRAAGHPDYSSAGTSKFIPEIWDAETIKNFYARTCLTQIANTKYEGSIKRKGDKVIIRTVPSVSIQDYSKGQDLVYPKLESASLELLIDKAKVALFQVDDIDAYQSDIQLMSEWGKDAGERMKVQIETDVFAGVIADPHASNKGTTAGVKTSSVNLGTSGSAVTVTSANIIETLAKCGQVLDEQDAPLEDRWFLMPPQMYYGAFLVSNLANASFANSSNPSMVLTGKVTSAPIVAGFNIFVSNLVPISSDTGNKFNCLFGQKQALTFASQITKSETVRFEKQMGDGFRQMQVFGYKTVKPEALGNLYCAVA